MSKSREGRLRIRAVQMSGMIRFLGLISLGERCVRGENLHSGWVLNRRSLH
jgi:hypothetical protein